MKTSTLLSLLFLTAGFLNPRTGKSQADTIVLPKTNTWVFLMAGQSNMAGRGDLSAEDSVVSPRVFSINQSGNIVPAIEPLHFYEPQRKGLDCGLSFGKELLNYIPENIQIVLIPTAIGGSSMQQWLGDSVYRNVQLFSNFSQKMELARQIGQVKGILWHQGESDASEAKIPLYKERLQILLQKFRNLYSETTLPVLIGELGSYSKNKEQWQKINEEIRAYAATDSLVRVIPTADFQHKGDTVHFNSAGQRELGKRFAQAYALSFLSPQN